MNEKELKFRQQQERILNFIEQTKAQIKNLETKRNNDETGRFDDVYARQIASKEKVLNINKYYIEFMRMPIEEDMLLRKKILEEYHDEIRKTISSELAIVFHGTSNIGIVREIIKSHGLTNPIERGEDFSSFASAIDVTSKSDIRVTCEFAEPNYPWLPYGAIFAFLAKAEEEDKVINTNGSEVYGGVDSVDFFKEPDRLVAIISTDENIDKIKQWCESYDLNKDKVFTHDEFLKTIEHFNYSGFSEKAESQRKTR